MRHWEREHRASLAVLVLFFLTRRCFANCDIPQPKLGRFCPQLTLRMEPLSKLNDLFSRTYVCTCRVHTGQMTWVVRDASGNRNMTSLTNMTQQWSLLEVKMGAVFSYTVRQKDELVSPAPSPLAPGGNPPLSSELWLRVESDMPLQVQCFDLISSDYETLMTAGPWHRAAIPVNSQATTMYTSKSGYYFLTPLVILAAILIVLTVMEIRIHPKVLFLLPFAEGSEADPEDRRSTPTEDGSSQNDLEMTTSSNFFRDSFDVAGYLSPSLIRGTRISEVDSNYSIHPNSLPSDGQRVSRSSRRTSRKSSTTRGKPSIASRNPSTTSRKSSTTRGKPSIASRKPSYKKASLPQGSGIIHKTSGSTAQDTLQRASSPF